VPPTPSTIEPSTFPWIAGQIAAGHVVVVSPACPLPAAAEIDRMAMTTYATRSLLAMPLVLENTVVGVLSCATVRREREWPEALIERLRLVAEVFASMLARHRAEAAARASEARFLRQREELIHALRVSTLGELGASLAHELNQPLSAILLNAGALRTLIGRGEVAAPDLADALNDIAADAKRAGDIIGRLRALARKEHVFQRGLSLDALVDEVAGLLQQDFVRRGIVVRRSKAPLMPPVSGDPIQLQQIVLNLLVNASEALEATERGNREITIETSYPAARLVELAVRDNAVGAKDVDLERMFERFVTTKLGGLGMGLAISRSIAEAHGGRIYAKANSERGLTVYVELPVEV
jgi:C4-dicarboxylate-specific signal transduction histidine kinase